MEMKTFQKMAMSFSPKIAIRIRGRHGIGKSHSVYQIGEALGLKVVERRLSQMTEGDIIGLPKIDENKTQFLPTDWLMECVHEPRVLFLDEINRALEGVKQACFQLADSRKFYGHELHPQTRLFVAENIGDQYQVNSNDPAEISRYAIVDLDPTIEEWIEYASTRCHSATVDFIRSNPGALEYMKTFEPNKKYPDRRAWFRLDEELVNSGLMETPESEVFYAMALSMVGAENAIAFTKFCRERDRQISAKDILADWAKAKKKMGKETNEKYIECISKLGDLLKEYEINDGEAQQLSKFMHDCPAEPRMNGWAVLNSNMKNLFTIHEYVQDLIVKTATGKNKKSTEAEIAKDMTTTTKAKKK